MRDRPFASVKAIFGWLLTPLFFILLAQPAPARDKGWVPLKDNNAASLNIPLQKELGKQAGKRQKKFSLENKSPVPSKSRAHTVYANQPPVTEKEVNAFIELLPRFRVWASKNGEEAHPIVGTNGEPDFLYSPAAAKWVATNNFDPQRFFCVMGRLAAGLVIVEEGNDYKGTRPADMPSVAPQELSLVRRHLGELLTVGGSAQPLRSE